MAICPLPFDTHEAQLLYRRSLPHWRQCGAAYFVTFRLADSVPKAVVQRWLSETRLWLEEHPRPRTPEVKCEGAARIGRCLLRYLDTGYGACLLRSPAARSEIEHAMLHFEGDRYLLGDYVIMPNHVHALVLPLNDADLGRIVASWTAYSAVRINRCSLRVGKVWQGEPFDHIVRSHDAFQRFGKYIRENPGVLPADQVSVGRGKLLWE